MDEHKEEYIRAVEKTAMEQYDRIKELERELARLKVLILELEARALRAESWRPTNSIVAFRGEY